MSELLTPFYRIWTEPPQQWHPIIVHFPIVFLVLEAVFQGLFHFTNKPDHERWAYCFLHWSFWMLLIIAVAGFHDVGLDLGSGNKIWLGLQDRWKNTFRFQSGITVHAWLAFGLIAITLGRLFWRKLNGADVLRGVQSVFYTLLTLIGLWFLIAAGYVGGLVTHK